MNNNHNNNILSVKKYLERINFNYYNYTEDLSDLSISYDTLSNLVYCHFMSVPYENFDILNNIPLSLEIPDLYDKIVNRRRGGYCFELNTLFNWLLNQIGFKTQTYIARFLLDEPVFPFVPMRRHRVMRTEIDGEYYIADIGVGCEVPVRPLKLVENQETEIRKTFYKFRKDENFGWVLQYKHSKDDYKNEWKDIYGFTEEPQFEIDFIQPNFWCQYSEDSPFRAKNIIAIRTATGKCSIDGNVFRTFTAFDASGAHIPLSVTEKIIEPSELTELAELNSILKEFFGIIL